jgi:hypothetical protein
MDTMGQEKKPNLYLDVDGVFFGLYGDPCSYQLRPGANSFMLWAAERFNCKWLTCWGEDQLLGKTNDQKQRETAGFMTLGYSHVATEFEYVNWRRMPPRWSGGRWGDKIDAIDVPNEDFYWLEDGIGAEAEEVLKKHGKLNRYLYIDERGEDGLIVARRWLEAVKIIR